jgi:hypothetical protein
MTLQRSECIYRRERRLQRGYRRGRRDPTAQLGPNLPSHTVRHEKLYGAPWDLDLELAELVLRPILPGWKGGIHRCGEFDPFGLEDPGARKGDRRMLRL